jgi:hypothetical protein
LDQTWWANGKNNFVGCTQNNERKGKQYGVVLVKSHWKQKVNKLDDVLQNILMADTKGIF